MKKTLLLFSFFITIMAFSQSYNYHPFPSQKGNWKWQLFGELMVPQGWKNEIYTAKNDTMAGSDGQYLEKNKQVFYQPKDSNSFELIYDFNLTVGDSFTAPFFQYQSKSLVIKDDSTGTLQGYPNRRFLQFYNGVRWVEGIGNIDSHYAMPYSLNNNPTSISGGGTFFRCQYADGISYPCADAYALNLEELEKNDEIKIYPNPTNGLVFLENIPSQSTVTLINTIGLNITSQAVLMPASINLSELPAGVYFIQIESQKKVITRRITKK